MRVCPTCGQTQKQAHRETLNKMKLTMLQVAGKHVKQTMKNEFKVRDFATPEEFKLFNNFQKLRYHGLIAKAKTGKGHWLITRNGWAFLRGDITLPRYVLIKDNHIESRSDERLSYKDVDRGAYAIETSFEYFDDYGQPVGFKPTAAIYAPEQVGML